LKSIVEKKLNHKCTKRAKERKREGRYNSCIHSSLQDIELSAMTKKLLLKNENETFSRKLLIK
jgi:hypothetical protein